MNHDPKELSYIIKIYKEKKGIIDKKINSFEDIYINGSPLDLFYELIFCILAAGTSAELAFKTTEKLKLKKFLLTANQNDIIAFLKTCYRFYNVRGKYIFLTREYLTKNYNFDLKNYLNKEKNEIALRNLLANDIHIKGIGMKAASHFLRNIGFKNIAILDKHILNKMKEIKLIPSNFKLTRNNYIIVESKLRNFAKKTNFNLAELDLILWFMKTGKIIK